MLKTVIFDMDGLILDTERLGRDKMEEVLSLLGYTVYDSFFSKTIGVTKKVAIEELYSIYGNDFPQEDVFNKRRILINEHIEKYGVPVKIGVFELMEYLKNNGKTVVVATSSRRTLATDLLTKANIIDKIDFLVCGDEVVNSKPNPDIFLKALEISDTKKDESIVLEDSSAGIMAANNAGIKSIMVPDMFPPNEYIKTIYFKEFPNLLLVKKFLEANSI